MQGSSHSSFLARSHLHQKVLVQVSGLRMGHVVLSLLHLFRMRGEKQAAGRRRYVCLEEGWKGRGRGRAGVIMSTSHGPASPASQSAGTQLHKAFALNLFLIMYPVTSKAGSFAKAMK